MSGLRLPSGGGVDRGRPCVFTFDRKPYVGFEGDSIASALLANGVGVVGRSFKYHRPRGIWGAWTEEPNAIVDVTRGGLTTPNLRATTEALENDLAVRSVNAAPTPGIFLNCGWGTGGFKAIPAGGTLLAHLLATGAHHEISRPFDLSRFAAGRLIDEAAGSGIAH